MQAKHPGQVAAGARRHFHILYPVRLDEEEDAELGADKRGDKLPSLLRPFPQAQFQPIAKDPVRRFRFRQGRTTRIGLSLENSTGLKPDAGSQE